MKSEHRQDVLDKRHVSDASSGEQDPDLLFELLGCSILQLTELLGQAC